MSNVMRLSRKCTSNLEDMAVIEVCSSSTRGIRRIGSVLFRCRLVSGRSGRFCRRLPRFPRFRDGIRCVSKQKVRLPWTRKYWNGGRVPTWECGK